MVISGIEQRRVYNYTDQGKIRSLGFAVSSRANKELLVLRNGLWVSRFRSRVTSTATQILRSQTIDSKDLFVSRAQRYKGIKERNGKDKTRTWWLVVG